MIPSARTVAVAVLTVLTAAALYASLSSEPQAVPQGMTIGATYDGGQAVITYLDSSGMTEQVTMEVLGLDETFQKTYHTSEFTEYVPFSEPPKYGWAVHPIVLDIDHAQHGEIRLKTEIRGHGEPAAPIIVSP